MNMVIVWLILGALIIGTGLLIVAFSYPELLVRGGKGLFRLLMKGGKALFRLAVAGEKCIARNVDDAGKHLAGRPTHPGPKRV
jgi:hypothetical protein